MNSDHMERRAKDRGIPPLIVEWLERFGDFQHDHHGALVFYFTKASRRRLESECGREPIRRMHEWLDAYLVVSTGGVRITVGKRFRRIRH